MPLKRHQQTAQLTRRYFSGAEVSNAFSSTAEALFPALQVDYDVALRLGATNQQIALDGGLERFGLVDYIARD